MIFKGSSNLNQSVILYYRELERQCGSGSKGLVG